MVRHTRQVHGAAQARLGCGRRGSPCSGRGELVGCWVRASSSLPNPVGDVVIATAPPTPNPTLLFLKENQRRDFICSPRKSPAPLYQDIPTPPPRQSTFPTDPAAWPQAGWPRTPQNPASSSPGTSGYCSAGCGASPGTDLPPALCQGQEGLPGWARLRLGQ